MPALQACVWRVAWGNASMSGGGWHGSTPLCTETYLVIGNYETEEEARNLLEYMKTRLFRFLMSLFMYSHGITRDTFAFIPILDMTKSWSDKKLYKRYALAESEIAYIESRIRPMEANGE